jgi:hypothetical protein
MTPAALLCALAARGVTVRLAGADLDIGAPADVLTAADLEALRRLKAEIVAFMHDVESMVADGTATRLRVLHTHLAADDRARLDAEGAAGDHLAGLVLLAVEAVEAPPDPAAALAAALAPDGPGWVRLWSRVLDAEVLLVRAPDVAVPVDLVDLPRFDRAEVAVLAGERPDADMLRGIVEAKRAIPGARVVADDGEGLLPLRPVGSGRRAGGGA